MVALSRDSYVPQVTPDCQYATAASTKRKTNEIKFGKWNVRTLFESGKPENLKLEMDHLELDILGLSEVRWRGNGEIMSDDYVLLYSGGAQHEKGVGFLMTKTTRKSVVGCWTISGQVIMIKLKCKPVDINLIQVYAPTSESLVEDLEEFYGILDSAVKLCKNNEIKIIMGDLNAKVGRDKRNTAVEWIR